MPNRPSGGLSCVVSVMRKRVRPAMTVHQPTPARSSFLQNQLASLRMSQRQAIELPSNPFDTIQTGPGLAGGLLPALAALAAGAAVLLALIASGIGQPLLVLAVAALATTGLFFLLAY